MSKPILYYFDLAGGRAEHLRAAFHIAGVEFEDRRLDRAAFNAFTQSYPGLSQVPVLEVNGEFIGQTQAITRYVGRITKLYPEDPLQAARVDQVIDTCEEIHNAYYAGKTLSGAELKKHRQCVNSEYTPWVFKELERLLTKNGSGYFVGPSVTIADLWATFILEFFFSSGFYEGLRSDAFDAFPLLKAMMAKVLALPQVVAMRSKHPRFQKYKLYYFNVNAGRAEAPRLALHIGGVPFEDVRWNFGEQPPKETPLAWPLLEVYNFLAPVKSINESEPILRFCGRVGGLYPEDALEALQVDEVLQVMEEAWSGANNLTRIWTAPTDEKKKEVVEEWIRLEAPCLFRKLEAVATGNKAHGWLVGSSMTIADVLASVFMSMLQMPPLSAGPLLPSSPNFEAVVAKVNADPKVIQWREAHKQ